MARTELTSQKITTAGIAPSPVVGTADGHWFSNPASSARSGTRFVRVENTGAVSRDITFQTGNVVEGHEIEETTLSIPAGVVRLIGPFNPRVYNRPAGGADPDTVYVDYDAAAPAELSIELYEFPIT